MMIDLYGLPSDGSFHIIFLNDSQAHLISFALRCFLDLDSVSDSDRQEISSILATFWGVLYDTCS